MRVCRMAACLVFCALMAAVYILPSRCWAKKRPDAHSIFSQENTANTSFKLDINRDVIVFVHIQKTGGKMLDQNLIHNLDVRPTCQCRKSGGKPCQCRSSHGHVWLFSRLTSMWRCGVHPDWTELHECLPRTLNKMERGFKAKLSRHPRRYRYITMLRSPVSRYTSEWLHTQRGADWPILPNCNNRRATIEEIRPCHKGLTWVNVTLESFNNCISNPARNRQTRMLADMRKVNCYNTSGMSLEERGQVMISSAKENLRKMAFFGLTDYYGESLVLLQKTIGVSYINKTERYLRAEVLAVNLDDRDRQKIAELNQLDVELYDYARDLFFRRWYLTMGMEKSTTQLWVDSFKNYTNLGS